MADDPGLAVTRHGAASDVMGDARWPTEGAQRPAMRRLRELEQVVVVPPQDVVPLRTGALRCEVIAMKGRTAALEPLDDKEVVWLPVRMADAMLTFHHAGALVALKGTLAREELGHVSFTVDDGVLVDRRRATRASVTVPVFVRRPSDGATGEGMTLDVSADGLLTATSLTGSVGDVAIATLSLEDGGGPLEVEARVVRETDGMLALELAESMDAARTRLAAVVLDHNRAVIHARRARRELRTRAESRS